MQQKPLPGRPLTGKALAAKLASRRPGGDVISDLARLAGCSRGSVEWVLKQDMIVPAHIFCAASSLVVEEKHEAARLPH